jgi:hypothetical protein
LINNIYVDEIIDYIFYGKTSAIFLFNKWGVITLPWGIIHQAYYTSPKSKRYFCWQSLPRRRPGLSASSTYVHIRLVASA